MSSGREDPIHPGRRAFLCGGLLTRKGRQTADASRPLGPPPPALTPELARCQPCTGCAAPCTDACAPGIVRLHPAGHPLAGTAYLTFEEHGCTFCHECVEACPIETGVRPSSTLPALATIDRTACVAWHGVICMSCRLACSYAALRMEGDVRPRIDDDACTGCGECVSVCPPRAISVRPT